jgi:hypothetical protein
MTALLRMKNSRKAVDEILDNWRRELGRPQSFYIQVIKLV